MSAVLIWIIFPGIVSIILFFFRKWERTVLIVGLAAALMLTWFAWQLPIGEPIAVRLWRGLPALRITQSMRILDVFFNLDNTTRILLLAIYANLAFWLGGVFSSKTNSLFTPLAFGSSAIIAALVAIEPSYFAPLVLFFVALICVPILSAPGEKINRGVFRFLIYQGVGTSLLFLMNIASLSIKPETIPINSPSPITLLTVIALALTLAVFPFHTWIPAIAEKTNPYTSSFVFLSYSMAALFLLLRILSEMQAAVISQAAITGLVYLGVFMVFIAGILACVEKNAGRILGFAVISQVGIKLLVLGMAVNTDIAQLTGTYLALLITQNLSMAVWALALSRLFMVNKDTSFSHLQGLGRKFPFAVAGLIIGSLSLAGLPILANFPIVFQVLSGFSSEFSSLPLFWTIGNILFVFACFRTLVRLLAPSENAEGGHPENRFDSVILSSGMILIFLLGLFPQWMINLVNELIVSISAISEAQ